VAPTLHGLPVLVVLTGAKADERQVLLDLLATEPHLLAARPGQVLIADKNYYGGEFERLLSGWVCGCCGWSESNFPAGG